MKLKKLLRKNQSKIVLLVLDGLGGLPDPDTRLTELETARTPQLDALATESICGLHLPISSGITPGSGPAHMALFGVDPVEHHVGRGALSAMGIDFDLEPTDVAARGNFCTLDSEGVITDRRAGRITTEKNRELVERLQKEVSLSQVEFFVKTIKEHRMLLVLRGEGLSDAIGDTDPNQPGEKPLEPRATEGGDGPAEKTRRAVEEFLTQARKVLSSEEQANMVLLRGFAKHPDLPTMESAYGLRSAVLASYPLYRGLARLLGMEAIDTGASLTDKAAAVAKRRDDYDFFFIHIKPTDSSGEDGDFARRVALLEEIDGTIPELRRAEPDVLIVTGDHSTPARLKSHSWHPVPIFIHSRYCRPDGVAAFGERDCLSGGLGPRLPATEIMPLALANALRLDKFGA
ncbi:MAG: 2,3-bisphosphoglycerate-independent phosphoglycerate mutase [Spirochaetaceae bacterium]